VPLRGSGNPASSASRKAFEHAECKTIVGKAKVKTAMMDFARGIDSEAEARNWGIKLRGETLQLRGELKAARTTLEHYATAYATEIAVLVTKLNLMAPHYVTLWKTLKTLTDYEKEHYGSFYRSDILGFIKGRLKLELEHYEDVLAKAQARLAIPAAISEAHLRAS